MKLMQLGRIASLRPFFVLESAEVTSPPPPQDQSESKRPSGEDRARAPGELEPAELEPTQALETVDAGAEITVSDDPGVLSAENVQAQQPGIVRKKSDKRSSRRHEIRSELQFMISANRQAAGPGVY